MVMLIGTLMLLRIKKKKLSHYMPQKHLGGEEV
jgi:hypothetical protein